MSDSKHLSVLEEAAARWKARIAGQMRALCREGGVEAAISDDDITVEQPPESSMGDLGFPMFRFARVLRKGPPQIAASLAEKLAGESGDGKAKALGPYLNVFLDRGSLSGAALAAVLSGSEAVRSDYMAGQRVMVEFSSPNTNKPLHLGHLRNDVLGESVSRILAACGADVRKVCIINDRGVHICKSMLAYKRFGEGKTPESEGVKSDHFVGDWYVRFNTWSKEDGAAEQEAQEMLRKWETGDRETVALWKKMNAWTFEGMQETWRRTGVSFDDYYFESKTYLRGKEEVLKGLERGLFYREVDGSVWADLSAENLDKKVLLRKDGTSLYITQDFGTAILRHEDWPFDRLVYVVGNEQQYHFQVLFSLLKRLGFDWAKNLYHLSYGMVTLPSGRMKSREGTIVDADDLLDELRDMALAEIREKEREEAVGDAAATAEKIALGALHYYLLQISPEKDMLYNPAESLSFNGNTGPYLQYMGARLSSMFRREKEGKGGGGGTVKPQLLSGDAEWALVKAIVSYRGALEEAAAGYNPQCVTAWIYELSKAFSRFYHDCPILNAENADLAATRVELCRATLTVLRAALDVVCIPFLESM